MKFKYGRLFVTSVQEKATIRFQSADILIHINPGGCLTAT